jgi:diguanylate cyclase (GGDEF)-like protein
MKKSHPDALTGVEDKPSLDRHLAELKQRNSGTVVVLFCDLDDFKDINDGLGHLDADNVLRQLGGALKKLIAGYTRVRAFRFGGDEFVVVLDGYTREEAVGFAQALTEACARLVIPRMSVPLAVSIGASEAPPDAIENLLAHADEAMRNAKRDGGHRIRFFTASQAALLVDQPRLILNPKLFMALEKRLRIAFVNANQYQQAIDFIDTHPELRLKCVSVLGRTDLLIFHYGDCKEQFFADIEEVVKAADAGDVHSLHYFEVTDVLKYHRFPIDASHKTAPPSSLPLLNELIDLAESGYISTQPQARIDSMIADGYALGVAGGGPRGAETEAYVTLDILKNRSEAQRFFQRVLDETLLPNTQVISIYSGDGHNENMQYVIRTRNTPQQLFEFIEMLHRTCHKLMMPPINTSTYMAVRTKTLRMYRSLLIPVIDANARYVRDAIIAPELNVAERNEFLLTAPAVQKTIIESVRDLDKAFSALKYELPNSPLRRGAVRAIVLGDLTEIGHVYIDLFKLVEGTSSTMAVDAVRRAYQDDLPEAVRQKIISNNVANRQLDRLTFGEARDILNAFHRYNPAAADGLPTPDYLEKLNPINDLRNRLIHGGRQNPPPEEAARVLVDFVQLIARYRDFVFPSSSRP